MSLVLPGSNTKLPHFLLLLPQKELQAAEEARVAREAAEEKSKPPEPKPKSLVEVIYEENRVRGSSSCVQTAVSTCTGDDPLHEVSNDFTW